MTDKVLSHESGKLNLLTSCCFIWTFAHAGFRECYHIQISCLGCLITSWFYHGFRVITFYDHSSSISKLTPYVRLVDMGFCQGCVVYFTYQCASFSILYIFTLLLAACIFTMYYIFTPGGDMWHSILHIVANVGVSCLIESVTSSPNLKY